MSQHLQIPFSREIEQNEKIVFPVQNTTKGVPKLIGFFWYYYSLTIVACLFLFAMPPIMFYASILGNRDRAYPLARWGAKTWLRLSGMKIKVTGKENLQKDQSYVFISNHRSYLDTAMMFAYLGRKMGIIAKQELKKLPIAGEFMDYVNILAIDRSNPERAIQTMNEARERMASGLSIGVFAEGTRALPGEMLPFKKGGFHLAIETGFPIIPVAMKYTDHAMGKKRRYATPAVCEMILLPPISTAGLTAEADLMNLLKETRAAIASALE